MTIFPSTNEKLVTTAIIAAVGGLAIGLSVNIEAKELIVSAVTLLAAFVGAYSAFALQNTKQQAEQVASRVEAGNKAIFKLIESYNTFLIFRQQFIVPHEKDAARFVSIPPNIGLNGNADFDFHELAYLFQLEDPNILGELSQFQKEVQATVELIREHAHLHLNGVQPTLDKAGFVQGMDVLIGDLKAALGERLTEMMIQSTDQMIEGVDNIIRDSQALITKLNAVHKRHFKGQKILRMDKVKT